jgi:hypothetical protein
MSAWQDKGPRTHTNNPDISRLRHQPLKRKKKPTNTANSCVLTSRTHQRQCASAASIHPY